VALRLPSGDQFGQVIDVLVAARRDAGAAHRFFERAWRDRLAADEPASRRVLVAFDELAMAI